MKNLIVYLVIALLITPSAFARKRGRHGDDGEGRHKIFKELDLSADQKVKLKEIRSSKKEKMRSLKDEKRASKKAFKEALQSGSSDSELRKLHKKMLSSHQNFKTQRFEAMLETRAILNDEQKKKFNELKSKMRDKRSKYDD